jgi:hypothetical protein
MEDVGTFYGPSAYFTVIWFILSSLGIFYDHFMIIWYIFSVLVCFTNKNLAALLH